MYHMLITSLTTHVIFCTLRWLETLLMFAASFYVTWMIFAALYYLICWYHGDLLPEHLPGKQEESNWKPCVFEMEDFASAFLFSLVSLKIQCRYFKEPDINKIIYSLAADQNCSPDITFLKETQHTIGYGSRQTTNECTEAIIVMSLQSVIGCLFQAFMVGLVFAKLARPQTR